MGYGCRKAKRLTDEQSVERLAKLKLDFEKLLAFHEKSFAEIDAKAKYWLTITLPSFVALMGYLLNQGYANSPAFFVATCSLTCCLFASTILFSFVLISRQVESGILAPRSRDLRDVGWYLESDER